MPRKALFTREHITQKALEIVRKRGIDALTARKLGKALESSPRPVFTIFRNMEEVLDSVYGNALDLFTDYVSDVTDYHPAFKELGIKTVRFAREEKHLFHYLFLIKDAENEVLYPKAKECLNDTCREFGITKRQSERLFRQMWTFTCGLALISTKDADIYPDKLVSEMLSFQFASTLNRIMSGKKTENITPRIRKKGRTTISVVKKGKHAKTPA